MDKIREAFRFFLTHKSKLSLTIFATFIFLFILFPFDDLSDLVTEKVSQLTNNSVYLQFEKLKLKFFPTPGAQLSSVHFESLQTPALSIRDLTITPSPSAFINQKPFGTVKAEGFLNGDVQIGMHKGTPTETGTERYEIQVDAKQMSLLNIKELANLPVILKGKLNLQSTILTDLALNEQPEMEINLNIKEFEFPATTINTAMTGPLPLPELKLSNVQIKGRLAAGQFIIEDGTIGKNQDQLFGKIKGQLQFSINRDSGHIQHQFGSYSLDVQLNFAPQLHKTLEVFLLPLSSYKTDEAGGVTKYQFRANAAIPGIVPNFSAVQ